MQTINLNEKSIQELQAFAYQLIVQREEAQRALIAVEQEIRIKIDQMEND